MLRLKNYTIFQERNQSVLFSGLQDYLVFRELCKGSIFIETEIRVIRVICDSDKKYITTNTPENPIILQILIQTIDGIFTHPTGPQWIRGRMDSLALRVLDADSATTQIRQRDTQAQSRSAPSEYLLIFRY